MVSSVCASDLDVLLLLCLVQLLHRSRTAQNPSQNKEPPLTTVPFIRVVLAVVVMVTDPTVGNAAQIVTAKLALRARARRCEKTPKQHKAKAELLVLISHNKVTLIARMHTFLIILV